MTAHHVGAGQILLDDETFLADMQRRQTLLNANGSRGDIEVFPLVNTADLPDLPILPLASEPLREGEEVLLIGFGRRRGKVIEWYDHGLEIFGFEWSDEGSKSWGTNLVTSPRELLFHESLTTHSFTFVFDEPDSPEMTRYEASAATGDSGGGVFVRRDGQWLLVGMMTAVGGIASMPVKTSVYGDTTFAASIPYYRGEILRWARPTCANEQDDDGDGKVDFPLDPGCHSPSDQDERGAGGVSWAFGLAGLAAFCIALFLVVRARS
jgi:hypothetical protein